MLSESNTRLSRIERELRLWRTPFLNPLSKTAQLFPTTTCGAARTSLQLVCVAYEELPVEVPCLAAQKHN